MHSGGKPIDAMKLPAGMTAPAAKQARAHVTRNKLLDAAVGVLCSSGYAKTTTTAVAKRAGMSQGALFKRFGSKHQLVAATAEHLFGGLVADFRNAMRAGQPDDEDDALGWIIRQLWAVFLKPELYAVTELYIAARTDEPLRQALVPVMWQHRQNLLTEARRLFPRAADENPHFEAAVDATMHAMQGAAMSVAVLRDAVDLDKLARFVDHTCRRELLPPFGEQP